MGISCHHVSLCPSVTSRCSTMLHNSPGTLVSCCWKSWRNSNSFTLNGDTKCRWGRLSAGMVAANWWLSTWSVVNLVRLQVYHTERPPYFLQHFLRSASPRRVGLSATADACWLMLVEVVHYKCWLNWVFGYIVRGEYLANLLVRNFPVSLWKRGDRLSVMRTLRRFVCVCALYVCL